MSKSHFGLDNKIILNTYKQVNFSIHNKVNELPLSIFIHTVNLFKAKYVKIEGYTVRKRNIKAGLSCPFQ